MAATATKPSRDPRPRWIAMVLGLLGIGTLLALAANIYQFKENQRLGRDLAAVQSSVQRQFADIKELESGELEQTLRRFDELNKQVQGATAANLRKARLEMQRNRSELTKALAQKEKDVQSQMSAMKADLKQDASSKVSQVSEELAKTKSELARAVDEPSVSSHEAAAASEEPVVAQAPAAQLHVVEAPKKKTLWSRLNPFRNSKDRAEVASRPAAGQ